MSETAIVKAITRRLTQEGFLVIKLHGGPCQIAGLPDLLVLKDGRAFFVEVKTATGQPTPLQQEWLRRLRAKGFTAEVVRSVDEAIQVTTAAPAAEEAKHE